MTISTLSVPVLASPPHPASAEAPAFGRFQSFSVVAEWKAPFNME